MRCQSCKKNIRPYDVWFLHNNKMFFDRKLFVGYCQNCKHSLATLEETRKIDTEPFVQVEYGREADKLIELCKGQIDYTRQDLICPKGAPFGFCFGIVKVDKTNKVYRIYRSDEDEQTELIGVQRLFKDGVNKTKIVRCGEDDFEQKVKELNYGK